MSFRIQRRGDAEPPSVVGIIVLLMSTKS
jgi:hypothetical protein